MSKKGREHLSKDEKLRPWVKKIGTITMRARRSPTFASLASSIIYQQLSGRVADVILERFKRLFGVTKEDEFPTPRQVARATPEKLRTAGISGQKAGYLLDLAKRANAGLVPTLEQCEKLTDAELIELLTEIKGVGRWTVEMLLIFNLGRMDVLPTGDLGVRKGYQVVYGKRNMPKPKQLEKIGKRWAPYRSLAARYFWRAANGE